MKSTRTLTKGFLIIFVIIGNFSCVSDRVQTSIKESSNNLEQQARELYKSQKNNSYQYISWDQAVELLEKQNQSLENSRFVLTEAVREQKLHYREYTPGVRIFLSKRESIFSNDSFGESDFRLVSNLIFSVPNPIAVYTRAYVLALQTERAKRALELDRRQQLVNLRRLFYNQKEIELQKKEYLLLKKGMVTSSALELPSRLQNVTLSRENYERRQRFLERQLGSILGEQSKKIRPLYHTIPTINYEGKLHRISPGKNFGRLAIELQAMELEAAYLRIRNAKIARWPQLSLSATSPQLYNSDSDTNLSDSIRQTTLFAGLSQNFELDSQSRKNLRNSKRQFLLVQKQATSRLRSQIDQLSDAKSSYRSLIKRIQVLEHSVKGLKKQLNENMSSRTLLEAIQKIQSTSSQLRQLQNQKHEIDLQFFQWDEEVWNP